jgi:hypothetical protein
LDDTDKKFIMTCYPKGKPAGRTTDGVYLVNCFKGAQRSSGVAWYKTLGFNDGKQPDAYIDVKKDGNVTWEGNSGSGKHMKTYSVRTCKLNFCF